MTAGFASASDLLRTICSVVLQDIAFEGVQMRHVGKHKQGSSPPQED